MTKEIRLTKGYAALVDDGDYEELARYRWHAHASPDGKRVYAKRGIWENGKYINIYMHSFITQAHADQETDHANGNTLDNRRANLRVCVRSENLANRRIQVNNKSGYKGVYLNRGKWVAQVKINRNQIYLGRFKDPVDAARAYDRKAAEIYGEFALLNFPS